MARKKSSDDSRNKSNKKVYQRKSFYMFLGVFIGILFVATLYQTSVYFSSNESCMMCHVHPHAEESWKLSSHVNNKSGVMVNCVDCHLPPKDDTWAHYTAKLKLGIHDVWGYLTKDSADFDWEKKRQLEYAVKMIPNESCVKCHQNLFPQGLSDDGITAHLHYDENHKKQDLHCISCHLDVGHYDPNYSHGQMVGIPTMVGEKIDTSLYYKESTLVTAFENFTEQIPGTPVSFNMIAIPGGEFTMGSSPKEPFHKKTKHHSMKLKSARSLWLK